MYKCSEDDLPCEPTSGSNWCSAKLPCGRCLDDRDVLSCGNKITEFTPDCDNCEHRFTCWTNRPLRLPLNNKNYEDLNSAIRLRLLKW
jgi:hypothetical protein